MVAHVNEFSTLKVELKGSGIRDQHKFHNNTISQ